MYTYRKLCLFISLIFISSFILCSCNNNTNSQETENSTKIQNSESTPPNYQYAIIPSEGLNSTSYDSFANAAELGLYTRTHYKKIEGVKNSIKSPFSSQTLEYVHSECSELKEGDETPGNFYSIYDIYRYENEKLQYLHNTDLLCYYFCSEGYFPEPIDLSPEDAVKISDEFLHIFLSDDQFAKFEVFNIRIRPGGSIFYIVQYGREIAGYQTDEILSVLISFSGKVIGYNGFNLNKYDQFADRLNIEAVETAQKLLEEKIKSLELSNCSMRTPVITANTSGELFLQIDVEYTHESNMRRLDSYFISIENALTVTE